MAVKALIFGTDDLYPQLKPFYDLEVKRGNLEIVGYAVPEGNGWRLYANSDGGGGKNLVFQIAIVSSKNNFYQRMKILEAQKIPRRNIIDGRVFKIPNLDFPRFINEGVAYGEFNEKDSFKENTYSIYPKLIKFNNSFSALKIDTKSYIEGGYVNGDGLILIGKFSSLSWKIGFNMIQTFDHNYHNLYTYALSHTDWNIPRDFYKANVGLLKIEIGNDVWAGVGSSFKCSNPNKPLKIGDGAVIASDSVVVKNVPPYAIVGGNPARIIKYRFSEDIIEALLRIKWWDWDIDKIYENFKYFNRIEEFVAMHDKGV